MSYNASLKAILDTPEIKRIKKLPLPKQRIIFKKISSDEQKSLSFSNILTKDIHLRENVFLRHYFSNKSNNIAILYIHGGGWSLGSVDIYDNVCHYLAINGNLNIFSLEYRLAPEHKFPTAVNDSLFAYDWLYDNCEKLGFSKDSIFVMGDSAGGNLATIICHERQLKMPKAQILINPVVDLCQNYESFSKFNNLKYNLTSDWFSMFIEAYINQKSDIQNPKCSPIHYKNTKQPNTFIIAPTHDILIDSIQEYEKILKRNGVNVQTHYDNEMFHGFISKINILSFPNIKIAFDKIIKYILEQ